MNDFGYFEYSDYAEGAKENANYTCSAELQPGSAVSQLHIGVAYDYASFEYNKYVTEFPKTINTAHSSLAVLTSDVSGDDGVFSTPITITAQWDSYYSMTGITILSGNIIKNIQITAFRGDTVVKTAYFSANKKKFFYDFKVDIVDKIVFVISSIEEAGHFLSIQNIEYGKTRKFDESTYESAEINNYCSILGDTLEYDTLSLTVNKSEDANYLFQSRQFIDYIVGGQIVNRFFIQTAEENGNNTITINAYDAISRLETEFLGGIYNNYSFETLVMNILTDTHISYSCVGTSNLTVSGYIPICTKRKALQMLLRGSNVRLIKGYSLTFKALESTSDNSYDDTTIIQNPQFGQKTNIRTLFLSKHNYAKGSGEVELYHWYVSKTKNSTIKFSNPVYSLKAYEVEGIDENGNDIVSDTPTTNLQFITKSANYCIVKDVSMDGSAEHKYVIKGKKYIDNTVIYSKTNQYISAGESYEDTYIEDVTIMTDAQTVCDYLFSLYARRNTVNFLTLEKPQIGNFYDVSGIECNISKIKHEVSGVYECGGV